MKGILMAISLSLSLWFMIYLIVVLGIFKEVVILSIAYCVYSIGIDHWRYWKYKKETKRS